MAIAIGRNRAGRWYDRDTGRLLSAQTVARSRGAVRAVRERRAAEELRRARRSEAARRGWQTRRAHERAEARRRERISRSLQQYWRERKAREVLARRAEAARRAAEAEGIPVPYMPIFPLPEEPALLREIPPLYEAEPGTAEIAFNLRDVAPHLSDAGAGNFLISGAVVIDNQRTPFHIVFQGSDDPDQWWRNYFAAVREILEGIITDEEYDQASIIVSSIR